MLADFVAIDISAVCTTEILDERVVEDGKYLCVVTADREIIDMDIVIRFSPDRYILFIEFIFFYKFAVRAEY